MVNWAELVVPFELDYKNFYVKRIDSISMRKNWGYTPDLKNFWVNYDGVNE